MADTTFVAGTPIVSAWLNDVNDAVYDATSGTAGTVDRTLPSKLTDFGVSVLDFIPVSEHAAIKAGTSTLDVSSYINAAIAASPVVYMPTGTYRVLFPINMSARRSAFAYWGRKLIGDGSAKTLINGYTGLYPVIDCTGNNAGEVSGLAIQSDNPPAGLSAADCASIGIKMGRGAVSTGSNQMYIHNIKISLSSIAARNGGNGTVGICNHACEHILAYGCDITANIPLVSHNTMQFTPAFSSNIPTIGVNYEQPYAGAAVSNTIHSWSNMILVAWDSFRAAWFQQAGQVEMPNTYTSTRKLVLTTPAFSESFYFQDCAGIRGDVYQETSGLYGATYRMDHRYFTFSGSNDGINFKIQRGVADYGFTLPGASASSIHLENGTYISNSTIDANYLIGMYNASGDNNGFATLPITFTGTPSAIRNCTFTLDHSGSHSAKIFSAIGLYCYNTLSINFLSSDTQRCDPGAAGGNTFTPVVVGLTTAGVGTYTKQLGTFERSGGWVHCAIDLAWTAHTGTGIMTVQGLPYAGDASYIFAVNMDYNGFTAAAGRQIVGALAGSSVFFHSNDPAGGAQATLNIDTVVPQLTLTFSYKVA